MSDPITTETGAPLTTEGDAPITTEDDLTTDQPDVLLGQQRLLTDAASVSNRFIDAMSEVHRVASYFQVLDGDDVIGELEIIDGTVTYDAQAEVRASLDLQVAITDDSIIPVDEDSLLVPYGNDIRCWTGVSFPDLDELIPMGRFRIQSAAVSDTGSELTLTVSGQDRSCRIIEAEFEEDKTWLAGAQTALSIVRAIISNIYPDADTDTYFTIDDFDIPSVQASAGDDPWAFIQGIATAIGAELYFNDDGVPVMVPTPTATGDAERSFNEGEVLTSAGKEWTRDAIANKILVTGDSGSLTTPVTGEALDNNPNSPTYYFGKFGKVPFFYSSQFLTTNIQATDAASGILSTKIGLDQQIDFGSLIDPRARALDIIGIKRDRIGIDEVHVLDAVSIPLIGDGTMTGNTRKTQVFS